MKSFFLILICLFFPSSMSFSRDQESVKKLIVANEKLKKLDAESVEDFAIRILESGFSYETLEPRITLFLKIGDLPFKALEKAITSEHNAQWRNDQITRLTKSADSTSDKLLKLELKASEEQTALRVYALCIEPWKYQEIRTERFTPKVCEPLDAYDHMRHYSDSVSLRTKASNNNNARTKAYNLLAQSGREIIKSQNLSNLEILMMAKCIAENSIRFRSPHRHLYIACHESLKASLRSPESAFFQRYGVCGNTSGITYNMARALGFQGELYLARHHLHVFLEAQVDGQWLHFHPLSSSRKSCDFVRFAH